MSQAPAAREGIREKEHDSALRLNGFGQDGAGFAGNGFFHGFQIVEGNVVETIHQGLESFLDGGWPVAAMVAKVRPWKDFSMAITRYFSGWPFP